MDLRQNQLPWSDQIWAKINADLAQALAQSRRVRAPFEVFHVPSSTQTVMADARGLTTELLFAETETTPIVELWVPFELLPSQVYNEGENFFSLDRIIEAAYELGFAEDNLLINGADADLSGGAEISRFNHPWRGIGHYGNGSDLLAVSGYSTERRLPAGLQLFNAVIEARTLLRGVRRYEPFALLLSSNLEGELSATIPGSNSLNTPIERMRALVSGGIVSTPTLPDDSAVVISTARAWVDIAQALEPSVQFLRIGPNGQYQMRLVERFALRLKDRNARCSIQMRGEQN